MLRSRQAFDFSKSTINDYDRAEKLGEGTYGVVWKATVRATKDPVALKKIRTDHDEDGFPSTALREISILRELHNHPNIVYLHHIISDGPSIYLVFEFCTMDLKKWMENTENLTQDNIKRFSYQLLDAMAFAHSRRCIHRDLKPQNILVDDQNNIKVADFGLARAVGVPMRGYTHEVVTLWYRPPEIMLGAKQYGFGIDSWSVGCIIGELFNGGQPIFRGDSEIDQIWKIFEILGTPTEESWPGVTHLPEFGTFPQFKGKSFKDFINIDDMQSDTLYGLLTFYPNSRLTCRKAMTLPYFEDMDKK